MRAVHVLADSKLLLSGMDGRVQRLAYYHVFLIIIVQIDRYKDV
jgi:hypothetical protein